MCFGRYPLLELTSSAFMALKQNLKHHAFFFPVQNFLMPMKLAFVSYQVILQHFQSPYILATALLKVEVKVGHPTFTRFSSKSRLYSTLSRVNPTSTRPHLGGRPLPQALILAYQDVPAAMPSSASFSHHEVILHFKVELFFKGDASEGKTGSGVKSSLDQRMSCTVNLLNFYGSSCESKQRRQEMYLR